MPKCLSILTTPLNNFDKSNDLNKNQQEHGMTEWQVKDMIWLGSDKNILSVFFCSTAGWPRWLFRQWDSEGNLKVWWTPATDEKWVWLFLENLIQSEITIRFLSKAKCIIDLYNNFTVTELGRNVTVSGRATQVWLGSKKRYISKPEFWWKDQHDVYKLSIFPVQIQLNGQTLTKTTLIIWQESLLITKACSKGLENSLKIVQSQENTCGDKLSLTTMLAN